MLTPATPEGHTSRHLLLEDHAALLRLFDSVLARFREDDREQTRATWALFESSLLGHLEAEEALILPAFSEVDSVEAQALRDDHARFRVQLDELAICVELHTIRADAADALVANLEAHSHREDRGMYAWAEIHLPADAQRHMQAALRASAVSA